MIVRVLVLFVALLLVAAPAERACAELCPDAAAEVAATDAPVVESVTPPAPPRRAATLLARSRGHSIALAPLDTRIFRPPRGARVDKHPSL